MLDGRCVNTWFLDSEIAHQKVVSSVFLEANPPGVILGIDFFAEQRIGFSASSHSDQTKQNSMEYFGLGHWRYGPFQCIPHSWREVVISVPYRGGCLIRVAQAYEQFDGVNVGQDGRQVHCRQQRRSSGSSRQGCDVLAELESKIDLVRSVHADQSDLSKWNESGEKIRTG